MKKENINWKKWSPLFLFFAVALLYLPTLSYEFVYDDVWYVIENKALDTFQPIRYFTDAETVAPAATGIPQDVYRPLSTTFFALFKSLFDLNSASFRFFGILLHLANGILFWLILCRFVPPFPAFVGALTFAVHPIQLESVAWISQQSILLCGFGVLASLYCWLNKNKGPRYQWGAVAFYAFALFAKETALAMPLVLVFLSLIKKKKELKQWIPFGGVAFVYLLIRRSVLGHWGQSTEGAYPFWESFAEGSQALVLYAKNIIFPYDLNVSYAWPRELGLLNGQMWIGLFLLAGLLVLVRQQLQKNNPHILSLGLFLAFWAPHAGIVQLVTYAADRFMYLPMLGVTSALAFALSKNPKKLSILILPFVLIIFSINHRGAWSSDVALWSASVETSPHNSFSHANLGEAYFKGGEFKKAEREYDLALQNKPTLPLARKLLFRMVDLSARRGDVKAQEKWAGKLAEIDVVK